MSDFPVNGYALFRRDRTTNGGGVGIYVRKDLRPVRLRDPVGMELIAVEMDCGRQRIIFASVYRTGNVQTEKDIFVDSLVNWISELGSSCQRLILTGDMNFDALSTTDYPFVH